jgi:hypothetical protein
MSTQLATARPWVVPDERSGRRLHAVEQPSRRRRPRMMYGLVAVAGALAIVGAQMVLSVMTTQTSYEVSRLSAQQKQLTWQKQILDDEITGLSSPQYLAANASKLGMVIAESPAYLRLSDGKVLGSGKAATGRGAVDPTARGGVANALIAATPLVTDPHATIDGSAGSATKGTTTESVTPVPVTDGLPTVRTH